MKFFIGFLLILAVHAEDSGNVCELKAETGRCRAVFQRFAYNKANGQCEEFTYGGCGGNGNNFETIEECQKACGAPAHAKCGENQESQKCATACPLTCDNMGNPPQFCIDECGDGCACKKGFVKNAQKCILPEQCPNQVSGPCKHPHEHHVTCGTSCPVTCANYNDTKPINCTRDCFVGCVCDEGFYREYGRFVGRCVAKEDCPEQGETIYVGTVEEPSLSSSESISHISYFEDSIVRPPSSKIAPPSSPGNAPNPKAPSPPTPVSTDSNKPAPEAPKKPSKKSKSDCNAEPSSCALTKPVSYGYYYNKEAKKCQKFPFANCKGSKNNFNTEEECKNLCIG